MKRSLFAGAAFVSALLLSATSFAGLIIPDPVLISPQGSGFIAHGAMGTAYHSSDNTQFIGCKVTGSSDGSLLVACGAVAAQANPSFPNAPTTALCTASGSAAVQFAQNLAAASSNSEIQFTYTGTQCTSVTALTYSFLDKK